MQLNDVASQASASNSRLDQIRGSILKVQQLMGCTLLSTTSGGRVVLSIQQHLEVRNFRQKQKQDWLLTCLRGRRAHHLVACEVTTLCCSPPALLATQPATLLANSRPGWERSAEAQLRHREAAAPRRQHSLHAPVASRPAPVSKQPRPQPHVIALVVVSRAGHRQAAGAAVAAREQQARPRRGGPVTGELFMIYDVMITLACVRCRAAPLTRRMETVRQDVPCAKSRAGGVHPRSTTAPEGGGGYVLAFPPLSSAHYLTPLQGCG
jgi:hypothetical protein